MTDDTFDQKYLKILLDRLEVCRTYKPKFGQGGQGVSLEAFKALYGNDAFYTWFGLDNPLMYAAHRAAGGITSIYRQIGIGSEELFRQLLQDHLGLTVEQSSWSYEVTTTSGRTRVLKLDGRIELVDVKDIQKRAILQTWLHHAASRLELSSGIERAIQGIVMEIRQGYKSKDSKRQNADIANAAEAYTKGYLPVLVVLSTQIDSDIVERYERGKWLVLQGHTQGDDVFSTYSFTKNIVGYDLSGFFQRNSSTLQSNIKNILESLLEADNNDP